MEMMRNGCEPGALALNVRQMTGCGGTGSSPVKMPAAFWDV